MGARQFRGLYETYLEQSGAPLLRKLSVNFRNYDYHIDIALWNYCNLG